MNFAKTPHILTKSLGTPLYKGETGCKVFTIDLTRQNIFA